MKYINYAFIYTYVSVHKSNTSKTKTEEAIELSENTNLSDCFDNSVDYTDVRYDLYAMAVSIPLTQ